jgi:hypothetical protein
MIQSPNTLNTLIAQRDALLAVCERLLRDGHQGEDNLWRFGPFADPRTEAGQGGTIEMLRAAVAECHSPGAPTHSTDVVRFDDEARLHQVLIPALCAADAHLAQAFAVIAQLSHPDKALLLDALKAFQENLADFQSQDIDRLARAYDQPDPPEAYGLR